MNSMEPSPPEATKKDPNILWNPKFHSHVHKSPPLAPLLSQINPVQTSSSYFHKIHFNIIPYPRLGLPSGLYLSNFLAKSLYCIW